MYDTATGKLVSDGTWTYKIPSAACIPQKMNVEFLKVGCPPLKVVDWSELCLMLWTEPETACLSVLQL